MEVSTVKKGVLVQEILRLLNQRWISANDVEGIPEKMGITGHDLGVKIFILNQVLDTYKKIPERYFKDSEHRENILETTQEALDDLIEEEEEGGDFNDDNDSDLSFDL